MGKEAGIPKATCLAKPASLQFIDCLQVPTKIHGILLYISLGFKCGNPLCHLPMLLLCQSRGINASTEEFKSYVEYAEDKTKMKDTYVKDI